MNSKEIITQVFPTDPEKLFKVLIKHKIMGKREYTAREEGFLKHGVSVRSSIDGSMQRIEVGVPNYLTLLSFTYQRKYPHCCALSQVYGFSYSLSDKHTDQGWFNELMKSIIKETLFMDTNHRIEVMMVEYRKAREALCKDMGIKEHEDIRLFDVPMIKDPKMTYPLFFNFWHTYAKKVNTRLMYNLNTGNIIHDMEVILP